MKIIQSQFEDINIDNFLIGMKEVINDKTEPKINGDQAFNDYTKLLC